MNYVTRLMRYYPSFTEEYVIDILPIDKGWAFLAAAIDNDGWLQFAGIKRSGKAYLAQEIDKLMKEAKEVYGR